MRRPELGGALQISGCRSSYGVRGTCYFSSSSFGSLPERPQAGPRPAVVAGLEVPHALVAGTVAHEGHAERDARVDAAVAGHARGGISGGGEAEECLLQVAFLQRPVLRRLLGEGTGEAVRGGFVLVRDV